MLTKVEYYTKNKKVYHYIPTEAEREEINARRRKMLLARRKAEEQAIEQDKLNHSGGYCPHCFILRPITGICPTCD